MSRPLHHLCEPVIGHVLRGEPTKAFVLQYGVSLKWVCATLWNAGIRRHYLTAEEWQHIRQRRAAGQSSSSVQP